MLEEDSSRNCSIGPSEWAYDRYRFNSVSNESSLREMSDLSSTVVDLAPSVIRRYSRRMESSLD